MEELLSKIDELEQKFKGLLNRFEAKAGAESSAAEEVESLKNTVEKIQEENEELKSILGQVRQKVTRLLERVEEMTSEVDNSPSLF